MTIVVSSSKQEKVFDDKDLINIGTNPNCDFKLDLDFEVTMMLELDQHEGKYILKNVFENIRFFLRDNLLEELRLEIFAK